MGFYEVAREANRFLENMDNIEDLDYTIESYVKSRKNNGNSVKATVGISDVRPEEYRFSVGGFKRNYTTNVVRAFDREHENLEKLEMECPEIFRRSDLESMLRDTQKEIFEKDDPNGDCISFSLNFVKDKESKSIKFCNPQMELKKTNYIVSFYLRDIKNEEKTIDVWPCFAKPSNGNVNKVYESLKGMRIGAAGIKKLVPLSEILNKRYKENERKRV